MDGGVLMRFSQTYFNIVTILMRSAFARTVYCVREQSLMYTLLLPLDLAFQCTVHRYLYVRYFTGAFINEWIYFE